MLLHCHFNRGGFLRQTKAWGRNTLFLFLLTAPALIYAPLIESLVTSNLIGLQFASKILTLNHTSSHSGMHVLCCTYTARIFTVRINLHEKVLLSSFRPCLIIVTFIFDKKKHGSGVVHRYFSESRARLSLHINQSVMESTMVQTQMILTPNDT